MLSYNSDKNRHLLGEFMKRAERLNQELIFLSSKKSFNLSDLIKEFNFNPTLYNLLKEDNLI